MSEQLKYGWVRGGEQASPGQTVASNQTFHAKSGKFVKRTDATTNTVTLCTTGDTDIMGHLEIEEHTADSTAGTEVRSVIVDSMAVYRIPCSGGVKFYKYMVGKKCDFVTSTTTKKQTAALNSATYGQLIIVDGDTDHDSALWVEVRLNPYVLGANAVGVV